MSVKSKKIIIIFIVFLLVMSVFNHKALAVSPSGFESVSQNDSLVLYLNRSTAQIAVENKRTGYIWRSNPEDASEDEIAIKAVQLEMMSQLIIKYMDKRGLIQYTNSHVASVLKDTFEVDEIDNGVKITYHFENLGFVIPVNYYLDGDSFVAEIKISEIEESGENMILNVTLLPYFGAAGLNDSGYIFVPDGSGAIINFNNGKSFSKSYSEYVYGSDLTTPATMKRSMTQSVKMPVFGLVKGNNAFFSIISENAGKSIINANVSGRYSSYNYVNSEFVYRHTASLKLRERDYTSKEVLTSEKNPVNSGYYRVEYYFLGKDDASYSGMANFYRDYLIENYGLKKQTSTDTVPLYLNLYGGVSIKKSFLGIPVNMIEPLTTFRQATDIMQRYKNAGVEELVIKYTAWNDGGLKSYIPLNAKPESKLGGNKGMKDAIRYAQNNDIKLFFNVDFVNLYKNGQGISKFRHAIKAINNGAPSNQYEYKPSSYVIDNKVAPWNLVTPLIIPDSVNKFINSYLDYEHNFISVDTLSSLNYSDFRKNGVNKSQTAGIFQEALANLDAKVGNVMLENANIFAVPYGDYIYNAPCDSSEFDITDETVPFYEMVLHGLVSYSSPPINVDGNIRETVLRCIETGAAPAFVITGNDTSLLKSTEYSYLYSTRNDLWFDQVLEIYEEVSGTLRDLSKEFIVEHNKLSDKVFETIYSNGTRIIVNYSSKDFDLEDTIVKGKGYLVIEGGRDND